MSDSCYDPEFMVHVTDCPRAVEHDGRRYVWTGKIGRRIGGPSVWVVEMEADDGSRVWVDARGDVYPD